MIGQTISRYRILEKIGEGGMGVVYKAEDTRLERTVALKFLSPRHLPDEESRKRFIREAKAAAALSHQNICTVYEIDEVDGQTFIAMAYIEGQRLDEKIAGATLDLKHALDIARQTADGLYEAHSRQIVHRDIKPSNIMLTAKGDGKLRVTVMDFGLAQLAHHSKITRKETIVGTVAYMSPEQTYSAEIDHRSDIWSLGVVLYEMVTGMTPFRGQYDKAVMYAITEEEPEPITALRTGVPLELDWIVSKALAKRPADRYQSAAEFGIDLATVRKRVDSSKKGSGPRSATSQQTLPRITPPQGTARRTGRRPALQAWALPLALLATAAALVFAALRFTLGAPNRTSPYFRVNQLTFDSGLTFQPAISPDGTLVAFASDRSGEGNLDIWLRHLGGGEPIRLTRNAADDSQPSFSPDGSRIAFRSERDGGGIHLIPVLGGEPRLVVRNGRDPRISPDGRWIAYWVGQTYSSFTGNVFVVETRGGAATPLAAGFSIARNPVWLPDSEHLLFVGVNDEGREGWWITPIQGGPSSYAPIGDGRFLTGFPDMPYPASADANSVLFSALWGTSNNIWRAPLMAGPWRTTGAAERVTAGAGREQHPSVARDGRLVFSSLDQNVNLWELPIEPTTARVTGALTRVTGSSSQDTSPSLTSDGGVLVFDSNRTGNRDIWLRDQRTGQEHALTAAAWSEGLPQITPDGTKVAYRVTREGGVSSVSVFNVADGAARTVCEDCSGPYGWSPDGTRLLARPVADTRSMIVVDLSVESTRTIYKHPEFVLYEGRFSPDGQWVAFHGLSSPTTRQIFVAPFRGEQVPVEDWIPVTDGSGMDRNVEWSPDGTMLYFLSERDGFRCVWAQRLDPATKRASGASFEVAHFHQAGRSMAGAGFNMSVTSNRLVLALTDLTGNVWLIEPDANP